MVRLTSLDLLAVSVLAGQGAAETSPESEPECRLDARRTISAMGTCGRSSRMRRDVTPATRYQSRQRFLFALLVDQVASSITLASFLEYRQFNRVCEEFYRQSGEDYKFIARISSEPGRPLAAALSSRINITEPSNCV